MKKKTLAGEKGIYALVATDICMSVTPNKKGKTMRIYRKLYVNQRLCMEMRY